MCTNIDPVKLPTHILRWLYPILFLYSAKETADISVISPIIAVDDEEVESITSKIEMMFRSDYDYNIPWLLSFLRFFLYNVDEDLEAVSRSNLW